MDAFYTAAKRYCVWLAEPKRPSIESIEFLVHQLTELITHLPSYPEELETDYLLPEAKKLSRSTLSWLPIDSYKKLYESLETDDVISGSLSDDLVDIATDLECGITLYESGQIDAARHIWRQSFVEHWGEHATSALRPLYHYLRNNYEPRVYGK